MKKVSLIALLLIATSDFASGQGGTPRANDTMTMEEATDLVIWREKHFPSGMTMKNFVSFSQGVQVVASWYGKEPVVKAYKAAGPRLILLIDQAGAGKPGGKLVVDFLAKYGAAGDAALWEENVHLLALGSAAQAALAKHAMHATILLMEYGDAPAEALLKASKWGVIRMVALTKNLKDTKRTRYGRTLYRIMSEEGEQAIHFICDRYDELLDDLVMQVFLEKPSAYVHRRRDLKEPENFLAKILVS